MSFLEQGYIAIVPDVCVKPTTDTNASVNIQLRRGFLLCNCLFCRHGKGLKNRPNLAAGLSRLSSVAGHLVTRHPEFCDSHKLCPLDKDLKIVQTVVRFNTEWKQLT